MSVNNKNQWYFLNSKKFRIIGVFELLLNHIIIYVELKRTYTDHFFVLSKNNFVQTYLSF